MQFHRKSCEDRARQYCALRYGEPLFDKELGHGQEGFVWESTNGSALKVFRPEGHLNFNREHKAYQILRDNGVSNAKGFEIPQLVDADQRLLVIEMTIVEPPYILDFGKVYFEGRLPDFSEEVMADYDEEREDWFEGDWEIVQAALWSLERFGIFYSDARPGNICCDGLKR